MKIPSTQGLAEAKSHVDIFARELLEEASRVASRNAAEEASADHVRRAAAHLYASGASRSSQVYGTVGGIVIGAASGAFISFLLEQPVNEIGLGVSAIAVVAGAIASTVGLVRR